MPNDPVLTTRKLLALAPHMVERISEYRFQHRIGSESEAMRRLIDAGLNGDATREPQHAQPQPLQALLLAYYRALVAAEPGIEFDAGSPEAEADAEVRKLGALILGWARDSGIAHDRDGLAAPVFAAIGALVPVPSGEQHEAARAAA